MEGTSKIDKYRLKPRVAVGIFLLEQKSNRVLLLKRKKQDGLANKWGPVCGKLEYLETIEDGILRELNEEICFKISKKNIKFLTISEQTKEYPHFVVIWYYCYVDKNKLSLKMCEREFLEYNWFPLLKAPKEAFSGKTREKLTQLISFRK